MPAPSLLIVLLVLAAAPAWAQTPLERGRYLVETIAACGNCHTPKGPGGEIAGKKLAGGFIIREEFGEAVTPNITLDPETGIGRWTDEQIVRAIREGKRPDGRTLGPPMPYRLYRDLSDSDVKAIIAYLRTVTPVKNVVAPSRYTRPIPESYGSPVGFVPDVPRTDPVRYGAYLVGPVAHCLHCHTPRQPDDNFVPGTLGSGGYGFRGPFGRSYAANLTSDPDTGIGRWSDGEVIASIYGARRHGGRVLPPMPTRYYAAGLTEADARAIVAYLRSLPAIKNAVPPPVPPAR